MLWQLTLTVPVDGALAFQEGLEGSLSASFKEIDGGKQFEVQHLFDHQPDEKQLRAQITQLSKNMGWASPPPFELGPVPEKDWVGESQRSFKPFTIPPFFVYTPFYEGKPPEALIPLKINAAQAFGTGGHETTAGCLHLLGQLHAQGHTFHNVLDFGCGTGILAFGAKRLWPEATVTGIDNDPVAIEEAGRMAEANGLEDHVVLKVDDAPPPIAQSDLVIANILLQPLLDLQQSLMHSLKLGGHMILSGILGTQVDQLVDAYSALGLQPLTLHHDGDWAAVVMQGG